MECFFSYFANLFFYLYFRYYFKTNCEDDVAMAVNQEVIDDSEILPLWEDKVLGIVKLVD